MGITDENEHEHCDDCSKEDEKKEDPLNEVQMAINDYTNDYNRNKHVILKSKNIDADKLSEIAIKRIEELLKLDPGKVEKKGDYMR